MSKQLPITVHLGLQSIMGGGGSKRSVHSRNLALGRRLIEIAEPREHAARGWTVSRREDGSTKLVADSVGRIEHLLLSVPRFRDPHGHEVVDPWLRDHFYAIIGHLGESARYTIVCQSQQQEEIERWFQELAIAREQLTLVFSKYDYSMWAQDAYIALTTKENQPMLCEGVRFLRMDDMVVADDVAAQTDIGHLHSILEFQGGNILGGTEAHLVGRDYVEWNIGRRHLETSELVVREFERILGGAVHVVGLGDLIPDSDRRGTVTGDWQPLFHLDMYVTRTGVLRRGREVTLVGSPRMARQLLKQPERPSDQDLYYDQAAEQLSLLGFEVDRIPLLPIRGTPAGWPERDYVLSWNNVLAEIYHDAAGNEIRRVLLPIYGDPENPLEVEQSVRKTLDAKAIEVWENLGFHVLLVDRMEDVAYGAGSVHCITKVLQRSPARLPQ